MLMVTHPCSSAPPITAITIRLRMAIPLSNGSSNQGFLSFEASSVVGDKQGGASERRAGARLRGAPVEARKRPRISDAMHPLRGHIHRQPDGTCSALRVRSPL